MAKAQLSIIKKKFEDYGDRVSKDGHENYETLRCWLGVWLDELTELLTGKNPSSTNRDQALKKCMPAVAEHIPVKAGGKSTKGEATMQTKKVSKKKMSSKKKSTKKSVVKKAPAKKAAKKGGKKKVAKSGARRTGTIGETARDFLRKKGVEKVTFEQLEKHVRAKHSETNMAKGDFYIYRSQVRNGA